MQGLQPALDERIRDCFYRLPRTDRRRRIWSVEIEGLPRIVLTAMEIIEQLLNHPALSFRLEKDAAARAGEAIATLRQILSTPD